MESPNDTTPNDHRNKVLPIYFTVLGVLLLLAIVLLTIAASQPPYNTRPTRGYNPDRISTQQATNLEITYDIK